MTLRLNTTSVVDAVGENLSRALAGMPAKIVRARGGHISEPTALNYRHGRLPRVFAPFFALLKSLGTPTALKVLEPVIGKPGDDPLGVAIDNLERSIGEYRNARARRAIAADAALLVPGGGRLGDALPGEVGRLAERHLRAAGDAVGCEGAEATGALSLVEIRQPPDAILSRKDGEGLRRHLSQRVVSLDAARALVQGDNLGRTGLAYQKPGDDWTLLPARENRLWTPDPEPRPVSRFEGNVVELRRTLDAAAASAEPVFVTHAGALLREGRLMPFHSAVVRMPGRAAGVRWVLTDFARLAS